MNLAMERIAQRIPLILVAGGKDEIVPYSENGALLQAVYQKGDTPFKVIIIGTSPWMGTVTNNRTLRYSDPLNLQLYDFLQAQMETGWTLFAQKVEGDGEEILTFLKDQKKNYPSTKQVWLKQREELLPSSFLCGLREVGIELKEYGNQEELKLWLNVLKEEVLRAEPPIWFDSFDREWAEWSNFSITLPRNEKENRILLVGDSISAGYGDMVQKKLSEFHVDRLNTSEGIHHPNFLRLLEIALCQYPYRLIHINNGIHLHEQEIEQYGRNLWGGFSWIHLISPNTKIVFATTPLSRRLNEGEMEKFNIHHFSMGNRAPIPPSKSGECWVTDEESSEIYRQLNEKAEEICAAHNIPVNNLYAFCAEKNLQKSDGVHFEEGAYLELAEEIAGVLRRELSIFP